MRSPRTHSALLSFTSWSMLLMARVVTKRPRRQCPCWSMVAGARADSVHWVLIVAFPYGFKFEAMQNWLPVKPRRLRCSARRRPLTGLMCVQPDVDRRAHRRPLRRRPHVPRLHRSHAGFQLGDDGHSCSIKSSGGGPSWLSREARHRRRPRPIASEKPVTLSSDDLGEDPSATRCKRAAVAAGDGSIESEQKSCRYGADDTIRAKAHRQTHRSTRFRTVGRRHHHERGERRGSPQPVHASPKPSRKLLAAGGLRPFANSIPRRPTTFRTKPTAWVHPLELRLSPRARLRAGATLLRAARHL
jgi:hypothetical protein